MCEWGTSWISEAGDVFCSLWAEVRSVSDKDYPRQSREIPLPRAQSCSPWSIVGSQHLHITSDLSCLRAGHVVLVLVKLVHRLKLCNTSLRSLVLCLWLISCLLVTDWDQVKGGRSHDKITSNHNYVKGTVWHFRNYLLSYCFAQRQKMRRQSSCNSNNAQWIYLILHFVE